MSDDWPLVQLYVGHVVVELDVGVGGAGLDMRALVEDVIDRIIERQMPR